MTKDKDDVTLTNISHPGSIAYSEEDLAPTKADAMVALWGSQTKCKVCGASFMPQNDGSKWHLATWDCSLVTGIDKP